MLKIILVAMGGGIGAVSRYLVGQAPLLQNQKFPIATLLVNILGSFGCGLVYELFHKHPNYSIIALVLVTGFLGGFTTFSAFSLETLTMIRTGPLHIGLANIFLNILLCLLAVAAGVFVGSRLYP